MRATTLLVTAFLLGPDTAGADIDYKPAPKKLGALIDRPPTPRVSISPDNKWMLVLEFPGLPPISELAQPELRLAGRRINPATNGPSRRYHYTGLVWQEIATGKRTRIGGIPADGRIGAPRWSPGSKRIAFVVTRGQGIALFTAAVGTSRATALTGYELNAAAGSPCSFADRSALVCTLVEQNRGPVPAASRLPTGPVVEETSGRAAPARTYQDLLGSEHDQRLFDYYFTSELAIVTIAGKIERTGLSGVVLSAAPSPDGRYILVETVRKPYSYLLPMSRFPRRVEIVDRRGRRVKKLRDMPLADDIPVAFGSVRKGGRAFDWRSDAPATVYWVEALDGGDARVEAKLRDRVFTLAAPFEGKPKKLVDLALRLERILWGDDKLALVSEWWWQSRKTRTWAIAPGKPGGRKRVIFDRSWEDRYNDPGSPVTQANPHGHYVLKRSKDRGLFLIGAGASPDGDRPFLDKLDLASKKRKRLWRSAAPHYEWPLRLLDNRGKRVITRREAEAVPPNYFIRDLREARSSEGVQLTRFPHPHPELAGVKKELIRYQRADGVKLTATLYLPPGYKRGTRLPLLMWAYPQEFKSAAYAGQMNDSPHRFARVGYWSPMLWLLQGYAILDDPTMPIIGEGKTEPNDTYVEQLVASASAAVDEVVRRGVADRQRIAIGGHSYGAFMVANLLAHSDLFSAGIAQSGAYNRTLTPFGFQSEERLLWQAPQVYFNMSPLMHADDIDEPLLIIHGEADSNSGTYPLQSKRLYAAIKGLGGTARLVLLPHESHGYRARESVAHALWEKCRWLESHVRRAPKAR